MWDWSARKKDIHTFNVFRSSVWIAGMIIFSFQLLLFLELPFRSSSLRCLTPPFFLGRGLSVVSWVVGRQNNLYDNLYNNLWFC